MKVCSIRREKAFSRPMQREGVPLLLIETDYSENDSEQIKTRVQAFLEMLG
ncbi:2-hydroxyacyl-CoA dehydratase [Thermosediminibacter litoriperuensis]|uniref:2-hydroxyglutaryl-CoA dehydratase D-component n=1 Tax=Thermosediminibacter litoriperuensis TaxID=291989 RepID=A0A5S5AWU7_9FIRM|nr:2-hydroxyacyl-CoA dehydratase family protein [Thermosediminibacter litoriperuensis]TYP57835.1 2-hydroxyglutaryl-CoA dehydratase D-component [Thermosediminibacter litoriperuensis]